MFDRFKPTTQMLDVGNPWHDGHTELFKRALAETGPHIMIELFKTQMRLVDVQ